MKKREYRRQRCVFWEESYRNGSDPGASIGELVDRDQRAAEVAGVVWDPEAQPLPERITYQPYATGGMRPSLYPESGILSESGEILMYGEAVRRYNAWPELEKKANEYGAWGCRFDELRAILRGGSR